MLSLSVPGALYDELAAHLRASELEQAVFMFTAPPSTDRPLVAQELYRVPPDGFDHQSEFHIALTDEVRATVIKRAHDLGGCLVEVHSHPRSGESVAFSRTDLSGLSEWVPHVRWRLRGRPYVALVFAKNSFDALVWETETPDGLAWLEVIDRGVRTPSGITYRRLAGGA